MPADHLAIPAAGTVCVTGVMTSSPLGSSSSYWRKATLFVGLFPHMKIQGGGMEYRQKATTGEGGGQGWLEKWSATWAQDHGALAPTHMGLRIPGTQAQDFQASVEHFGARKE